MRTISLNMNNDWFIKQNGRINMGYQGESDLILEIETDFLLDMDMNYYLDIGEDTLYMKPENSIMTGKLIAELTSASIGKAGSIGLQVRASSGKGCIKSNIVYGFISDSLNSECRYPNGLPTEFAQYEDMIRGLIEDQKSMITEKVEDLVDVKLPDYITEALKEETLKPMIKDAIDELDLPELIDDQIELAIPAIVKKVLDELPSYQEDPRSTIKRTILDYLYTIEYSSYLDYRWANKKLADKYPMPVGACSGFRYGDYHLRNLDFAYADTVDFIVHHKANGDQLEYYGIAGSRSELTKEVVESGVDNELYPLLPYIIQDGINSCGVVAQFNMISPLDFKRTTGTKPEAPLSICTLSVVSYILSHCRTAEDAEDILMNQLNIWTPCTEGDRNSEYHWMISDENNSYLFEIVNNEPRWLSMNADGQPAILTNFIQSGEHDWWDECAYIDSDGHNIGGVLKNMINAHGEGVERYEILRNQLESTSVPKDTPENLLNIMKSVKYTNSYASYAPDFVGKVWDSDLCGVYGDLDLKVTDPHSKFALVEELAYEAYLIRERDGKTWQTAHTTLYDIPNRSLKVYVQEDYTEGLTRFIDFPIGADGSTLPGSIEERVAYLEALVASLDNRVDDLEEAHP